MARKKKSKSKSKPKKKRVVRRKRRANGKKRKRVVRRKRRANPPKKRKRVIRRKRRANGKYRRRRRNPDTLANQVEKTGANAESVLSLTKAAVSAGIGWAIPGFVAIALNDGGRQGMAAFWAKDKNKPTREDYIKGQAAISVGSVLLTAGAMSLAESYGIGKKLLKTYKVPILIGTCVRAAFDVANAALPRTPKSTAAGVRRAFGLPLKLAVPASMATNADWHHDPQKGVTIRGEISQYDEVGGYENWGMAGYEDWGMAGYENWGVAGYESDLGTMSPGYEVGALPAAGHELGMMDDVGSMPVGHELSGNPYGNPYGGSANPFA